MSVLELEKLKPNFSCRKRNFYFRGLTVVSRGLKVVQPRSEGCSAEAEGRGWTFRPRLDIQTKAGSQTKEMKVPLKA